MLLAAAHGHAGIVRVLAAHTNYIDLLCMHDGTALLIAAAFPRMAIVELFFDLGACIDITGAQYRDMMQLAIDREQDENVPLLLHIGNRCAGTMDGEEREETLTWLGHGTAVSKWSENGINPPSPSWSLLPHLLY